MGADQVANNLKQNASKITHLAYELSYALDALVHSVSEKTATERTKSSKEITLLLKGLAYCKPQFKSGRTANLSKTFQLINQLERHIQICAALRAELTALGVADNHHDILNADYILDLYAPKQAANGGTNLKITSESLIALTPLLAGFIRLRRVTQGNARPNQYIIQARFRQGESTIKLPFRYSPVLNGFSLNERLAAHIHPTDRLALKMLVSDCRLTSLPASEFSKLFGAQSAANRFYVDQLLPEQLDTLISHETEVISIYTAGYRDEQGAVATRFELNNGSVISVQNFAETQLDAFSCKKAATLPHRDHPALTPNADTLVAMKDKWLINSGQHNPYVQTQYNTEVIRKKSAYYEPAKYEFNRLCFYGANGGLIHWRGSPEINPEIILMHFSDRIFPKQGIVDCDLTDVQRDASDSQLQQIPEERLLDFLQDASSSSPPHEKKRIILRKDQELIKFHGVLVRHKDQIKHVSAEIYNNDMGLLATASHASVQARIEFSNGNVMETAMVPLPIMSKFKPDVWLQHGCDSADEIKRELQTLAREWKKIDSLFNLKAINRRIDQDPLSELRSLLQKALRRKKLPLDRNIAAELFLKRHWIETDSAGTSHPTDAMHCIIAELDHQSIATHQACLQ